MTQAQSGFCDNVKIMCDVIDVRRFYIVVVNRATGIEHSFSYDNILIGSSDEGEFYELVLPRWLANHEGISDAQ